MRRAEQTAFASLLDILGDVSLRIDYEPSNGWWSISAQTRDQNASPKHLAGGDTLRDALEEACRAARRLALSQ